MRMFTPPQTIVYTSPPQFQILRNSPVEEKEKEANRIIKIIIYFARIR